MISSMENSSSDFRWVHLSDIHVGVGGHSELWPRFRTVLLDDLSAMLSRTGTIDFIVFSGDLTQKGAREEFDRFDENIEEIISHIGTFQQRPKLIAVPGNHDLVRPHPLSAQAIALKQFWNDQGLRDGLWRPEGKKYLDYITKVFKNFLDWQRHSIERGIHAPIEVNGIMPGDAAYFISRGEQRLGVIALNSTWLQLSGSNYEGELHVDVRQINELTGGRTDEWTRSNSVSLIVTHHPKSWLHPSAPASWDNDINPAGRFDAHLFGHMHIPKTASEALGGGLARRDIQASSLFGLEKFGNGQFERIQGYAICQVSKLDEKRVLTFWPRRLVKVTDGKWKLTPDAQLDIDELTSSYSISYQIQALGHEGTSSMQPDASKPTRGLNLKPASNFNLAKIQRPIAAGDARAHRNIRRVEHGIAVAELREKRAIWLTSDWGMGTNGFISAVASELDVTEDRIYSIEFSGIDDLGIYLENLQARLGCSFQQVCDAISDAGRSILILNDIEISRPIADDGKLQIDVESLTKTLIDFLPDTCIILGNRRTPRYARFQVIELKALDEADVATYVRDSELGDERYAKPDAASAIHRHTDGIPSRIDEALRDLEIISLGDLISSNADFGQVDRAIAPAPPALVTAIQGLQSSEDKAEQRAYQLLLALASLPQGEQLARIKRFLGPHPFGPAHARALLERSLIEAMPLVNLAGSPDGAAEKVLSVPRPVREYVRDATDSKTSKDIDSKALELYFGADWNTGKIHDSSTSRRLRDALCENYEIQNAIALIIRATRRALDNDIKIEIDRHLRLARAFIDALVKGDHFRSIVGFCEVVIRLLEDRSGYESEINGFRYEYARNLRMSRRHNEARDVFEGLDKGLLTKSQQQRAELGLALCLERLGDKEGAAQVAKRTIAIERNASAALQAETIIAEQIKDGAARVKELRRLLAKSRRKKLRLQVNNILLTLAHEKSCTSEERADMRSEVIQLAHKDGDFYNLARAIVALATEPGARADLTIDEKNHLIGAYYFLYNERLSDLFDRCHEAMWALFEREGNSTNLLNLFRHSSFIWRLNNQEEREAVYLRKLVSNLREVLVAGIAQASRDGAYFVVRVLAVIGNPD